jgi:hypothetical protein
VGEGVVRGDAKLSAQGHPPGSVALMK